jgi:hypothetical protein
MELTLDDYLAEFDRWKERASAKRKAREEANQPAFNDDSLIRMEQRIGRTLPRVTPGETPGAGLPPGDPTQASNAS